MFSFNNMNAMPERSVGETVYKSCNFFLISRCTYKQYAYIIIAYVAFSLIPSASACFFAFSRKSAMLEFLLWAAASAARLSGY